MSDNSYAERIGGRLNQDAVLKKQTDKNEYGTITYGEDAPIKCRKVGKTMRRLDKNGEIISTKTSVITTADVHIGDSIDDEVVKDTQDIVDLNGSKIGVVCYL